MDENHKSISCIEYALMTFIVLFASVLVVFVVLGFVCNNECCFLINLIKDESNRDGLSRLGVFWTRLVFPIATGLLALVALLFTFQRTTANLEQVKHGEKQLLCSQEQFREQIKESQRHKAAEQFSRAVDQLGSEKPAIILGGVHTLHHIASSYPQEYAQTVFEILCSFIREETSKDKYRSSLRGKNGKQTRKDEEKVVSQIVIQTIIDKLFRKDRGRIYGSYQANLTGAVLRGCNLYGIYLANAILGKTDLSNTDMDNADLRAAALTDANLRETQLKNADLRATRLVRVHFDNKTELNGARLHGAQSNMYMPELCKKIYQNDLPVETDLANTFVDGKKLDVGWKDWFVKKEAIIDSLCIETAKNEVVVSHPQVLENYEDKPRE